MNEKLRATLTKSKRTKIAIGLKTSTPVEIKELMEDITSLGAKVKHETTREDGTKLPCNGILRINY